MTSLDLMKWVPDLRPLPLPQLMRLAGPAYLTRLSPGAPYLQPFHTPPPAAFLAEGFVTLHLPDPSPQGHVLPAVPGEWLMASALLQARYPAGGPPYRATIHSPVVMVHLPGDLLLETVRQNPELALSLAQVAAKQHDRHRELLATALHTPVPERLLYLLRLLALLLFHAPTFRLPYPQATLARMLGCSREALSRAFSRLEAEGYLLRRGRVVALDPDGQERAEPSHEQVCGH